jgi:hypothetical protein
MQAPKEINKHEIEMAFEQRAKAIFIPENLGAILLHLNKLVPRGQKLTKGTEFETVVNSAKIDGMTELLENLKNQILNQ